nr:aminoglycoside phosphotransferase family protein [Thalassococcus arenae]
MTIAEAETLVRDALRAAGWPADAPLVSLKPPKATRPSCVFRLDSPTRPAVLKVWSPAMSAKAARQVARQDAVARGLGDGAFRAPAILFFDPDRHVVAMALVAGRDAGALWQDSGDLAHLRRAGSWVAALHGLSAEQVAFRPAGLLNWLDRLQAELVEGGRPIPDAESFREAAAGVQALASTVRKAPARRAITHRDLNLSNMIIGDMVWGLDFENDRPDDAARDIAHLALDAMARAPQAIAPRAVLAALRDGYGDSGTAPEVTLFLQRCFCLGVWANTKLQPSRVNQARLDAARWLLKQDEPLI